MCGRDDACIADVPVDLRLPALRAASRGGSPGVPAVRCGDPIAESLWPTLPENPAGVPPLALARCRVIGARLASPMLLRFPCNLYAANGFPVSACS